MNLGKVILCGVLTTCPGGHSEQTNATRWPSDPPERTFKDVVLVGDSIAAAWPLAGALNHGIGGQRVEDVDRYFSIDALIYHPRAVVIEGGVNDLKAGRSIDEIVQHRINLLRKSRDAMAASIFTGLVPLGPGPECAKDRGLAEDGQVEALNVILRRICEASPGCYYADFEAAFGGKFDPRLYQAGDCTHPNEEGYAIMNRVYNESLRQIPVSPRGRS